MTAVGIDLGTTNSVISVLDGASPTVIPNSEGERTTPSVVAFPKSNQQVLVGSTARRQAVTNALRTVKSVKRFMGDPSWSLEIELQEGMYAFTPQEISARILSKLKADAESFLGHEVSSAVITVPAYFDDAQRQATKEAGEIAGLNVLRLVAEPTAAALAYGLDSSDVKTVLVFDLGGGTFDVSVLEISNGVFEVRSTSGDSQLGGDDWDAVLVNYILEQFEQQNGFSLKDDPIALQRIEQASEDAKKELSTSPSSTVSLPFLSASSDGPLHVELEISRELFEELASPLAQRLVTPFKTALSDAGLNVSDLDEVILVGGATRMPHILRLVEQLSDGKSPHKGVNPDEVVALGAALQAGVLSGDLENVLLLDVTPLSLGLETKGGLVHRMIERNTTIPTMHTETFTTAADNQTSVEISVVQGEREFAHDNKHLGRFLLSGLPPAPRGVPQVEVTFDIDPDGIVHVSAIETASGLNQSLTITGGSALSSEEIEDMIAAASSASSSDSLLRARVELANEASSLLASASRLLDSGSENETVSSSLLSGLSQHVARLEHALEMFTMETDASSKEVSNSLEFELRSAIAELTGAYRRFSQVSHKNALSEPASQQEHDTSSKQNSAPTE